MELNSITATIGTKTPTVASVSLLYEGGATKSRKMHLSDFVRLLKNATENEIVDFKANRFKVPKELVELSYIDSNNFHGLFLIPGQVFFVTYCNKKYPVPYPPLLFSIRVVNGKVNKTNVFAVKEEDKDKLGDDTMLYNFPFGNVYQDGSICWGGNVLPQINGLSEVLKGVIHLFYSAETNADLWNSKRVNIESIKGCNPILSSVYDVLSSMDTFPLEALVPSTYKMANLFNF